MGVTLKGAKELRAALEKRARAKELAANVVKYHGAQLQQNAQRICPVSHRKGKPGGTLKRSIRLEIRDKGLTAEVAATTNYAGYVEWGTRYMHAQPYMRPSYEQQVYKFLRDLENVLDD